MFENPFRFPYLQSFVFYYLVMPGANSLSGRKSWVHTKVTKVFEIRDASLFDSIWNFGLIRLVKTSSGIHSEGLTANDISKSFEVD